MTSKPTVYRKGDVVLVSFPYTTDDGQTQTKRRPAVLISNDYNNARLDDVLLVPLTSNTSRAAREPTQVEVLMNTPRASKLVCVWIVSLTAQLLPPFPRHFWSAKLVPFPRK